MSNDTVVLIKKIHAEQGYAILTKGDVPGHEFHGNQYTGSSGGGKESEGGKGSSQDHHAFLDSLFDSPDWGGAGYIRDRLRSKFPGMTHAEAKAVHEQWAKEKAKAGESVRSGPAYGLSSKT